MSINKEFSEIETDHGIERMLTFVGLIMKPEEHDSVYLWNI